MHLCLQGDLKASCASGEGQRAGGTDPQVAL